MKAGESVWLGFCVSFTHRWVLYVRRVYNVQISLFNVGETRSTHVIYSKTIHSCILTSYLFIYF